MMACASRWTRPAWSWTASTLPDRRPPAGSRSWHKILPDDDRREAVIEVKDETGQRMLVAKLSVSIEATELPGFSPVE